MKLYKTKSAWTAVGLIALSGHVLDVGSSEVNSWPSKEEADSTFQVLLPKSLKKEGGYLHKDAFFGHPAYMTGSLQVQLVNTNGSGCEPFANMDNLPTPFALLVNRGACPFTKKVRQAQAVRASAIVIVDDTCLCSDTDCMDETGDAMCETNLPYMVSDSSTDDILIPSMLIRKSDGARIRKAMKQSRSSSNTVIQMEWKVPAPDRHVEWVMWQSAWDDKSMVTLDQLEDLVTALGPRSSLTPRYVMYNGSNLGCHDDEESADSFYNTVCGNMCLNKGRYCLLDPSPMHDTESGASGADVVTENLRRKCIWKHVSKEDGAVGKKWWAYVKKSGQECGQDEIRFRDHTCAENVLKSLKIDSVAIEKCMQPYGIRVNEINPLLEEELREQTALEILRLPALYVDGLHARGRIDLPNILHMVCAGFGPHDPPAVCTCGSQPIATIPECIRSGGMTISTASGSNYSGMSFTSVLGLMMFICGTVAAAGYAYWRRTQSQMREQVRSILAEYMPMEDQALLSEDGLDSPNMHPAELASSKSPRGFLPSRGFVEDDDGM
uniref:Vacuolarsorting receptor putative n=1 Tax=Albugo laibachii Nc14 TaxID=890382 RepID=F0WIH7_9STRA|nr:vacuolarsorting receptor putative [Albugo laibachii Nc14]|eukprot:CCA21059.1 vacuolarsorting receptor putative [Albugo laibachii Nc14]